MNIYIDISPLKIGNFLSHRVRGTGQYLESLRVSLKKYFPENNYFYFTRNEKLPSNADVIHYPYFEPFFLTLPFGINKKSIVTVHDLTPFVFPNNFPSGIKGKIKWQIQKFNLKRAGLIITDSNSSKEDIVRYAGISSSKIKVVYLAADERFGIIKDKVLLEKIRSKYKLPEKFALYVGDITWNKNLPRVLEAVKKTDIPIVLVGKAIVDKDFDKSNPWNQDRIEIQEEILKNENIKALGFVSSEELVSLYNLATVFIMPSIYEGFGLPILEAMACGCPVLTSKAGSIPEIAGNAAFYANEKDVEDIKNGLIKVFNDKDLQKDLSDKGLKQCSIFTWKNTASETLRAYKEVVQN